MVRFNNEISNTSHFLPSCRSGTFFCIYRIQNRQHKASLITVEMAHPLLPACKTTTKNKSPKIFRMELIIKKYRGDLLSPKARSVLAKKLYKKVKTKPAKMI